MNRFGKTGILVVIVLVLSFMGCSTLNDFYVQNFTQTKKTIKINYKTSISKVLNPQFPGIFSFSYENEIIKPRLFVTRKNLKSLEKTEVGDSALILEIPPYSTVRIERTRNQIRSFLTEITPNEFFLRIYVRDCKLGDHK